MSIQKICLIGGSGRSGTSILHKIFSNHPDIASVPEWRFSIDPDGLVDFYNTFLTGWSPYLYDIKIKRLKKLLDDIGNSNFFEKVYSFAIKKTGIEKKIPFSIVPNYSDINVRKYCPHYSNHVDKLISKLVNFSYFGKWDGQGFLQKSVFHYGSPLEKPELQKILGNFWRDIIKSVLENQNTKNYLEKNTWNILWFDKIIQLLPEAKLVHIYRDPRDVVASYTKQIWSPSNPEQAAILYCDLMKRWFVVRSELPVNSYYELSLESLVENKKESLEKTCSFWDIEWNDALMRTDLGHAHTGRWKKDLMVTDQKRIEAILEKPLEVFGYKK